MNIDIVLITCFAENCGITFGVERGFADLLVSTHRQFYCPNGHGNKFIKKTTAEELQAEVYFWEERCTELAEDKLNLEAKLAKVKRKTK